MNQTQFVIHNRTKERGLILETLYDGCRVQWLNSRGITDEIDENITIVLVPVATVQEFCHGVTLEQIEILEQTFAVLTVEGWIIPEWINNIRNTIKKV